MLSLLDLFSGIGGFSLGMEATKRINTVAFCEKDEYCRKVLKKHWSNTKQYIDIRDVDGTKISADIISGGFPCQPFSVAGKRKGTTDDRYLWDEMLRIITEVKPRWVVGENVQGIINIDNGLVLRQVQTDLEAQGFQVQCFLIPASGIGAWHRRNRVWIIANSKIIRSRKSRNINQEKGLEESNPTQFNGSSSDVSNSNSGLRRRRGTIKESGTNEIWGFYPTQEKQTEQHIWSKAIGCDALSGEEENATNTNGERQQKQRRSKSVEKEKSGFECESWWKVESSVCGVPDGISHGLDKGRVNRIKSLGNSIVPQIAFEIGRAIVAAEEQE
jgi:DNA (cytosine-5)-methyltransferase 1